MMYKTATKSILAAAALTAGYPAIAWQDTYSPSPDAAKPGDEALTCDQLRTEMGALETQMLAMSVKAEKIAKQETMGAMAKQSAGNLAKQALSGLASTLIPGAGGLIGMGIDAASSSSQGEGDRAAALMSALQPVIKEQTGVAQRMQQVGMLHADKCTAMGGAAPQ